MKLKLNKGFTLIELLVVIAIIGVLSAVVLASLNTARSKGNDAAIMSNIDGIRTQAAVYTTDHGTYGTNALAVNGDCAAASTLFSETTIQNQVAAAVKASNGGTVVCNVAVLGASYAVSAPLIAVPDTFYCIDSVGSATTTTAVLASGDTTCN